MTAVSASNSKQLLSLVRAELFGMLQKSNQNSSRTKSGLEKFFEAVYGKRPFMDASAAV